MTFVYCENIIIIFFKLLSKPINIMNTVITAIPIVIAAIVIVIMSKKEFQANQLFQE